MTQTTTPTTFLPHLNFGWSQGQQPPFAPWEVALAAVLAGLVVVTAFVFVRRMRRA